MSSFFGPFSNPNQQLLGSLRGSMDKYRCFNVKIPGVSSLICCAAKAVAFGCLAIAKFWLGSLCF